MMAAHQHSLACFDSRGGKSFCLVTGKSFSEKRATSYALSVPADEVVEVVEFLRRRGHRALATGAQMIRTNAPQVEVKQADPEAFRVGTVSWKAGVTISGTSKKAPHGYGPCPSCGHPNVHLDERGLLKVHGVISPRPGAERPGISMTGHCPGSGSAPRRPSRSPEGDIRPGMSVRYKGDMANPPGAGRVLEVNGDQIRVELDADPSDFGVEYGVPRRQMWVSRSAFGSGPGDRFEIVRGKPKASPRGAYEVWIFTHRGSGPGLDWQKASSHTIKGQAISEARRLSAERARSVEVIYLTRTGRSVVFRLGHPESVR